ncbi:MAG TPA: hypothetical protein VH482_05060 [Thermomicrobiales bacterium]|jgi:hypothetical protein
MSDLLATRAVPVPEVDVDQERLNQQSEALAALFRSWREVGADEIAEQNETLAILKKTLNEEPLSDRPRFR